MPAAWSRPFWGNWGPTMGQRLAAESRRFEANVRLIDHSTPLDSVCVISDGSVAVEPGFVAEF